MWHYLQLSAAVDREFASALSRIVPLIAWEPSISAAGVFRKEEREEQLTEPPLRLRRFPLQRGYARFPVSLVANVVERQIARMLEQSDDPSIDPLICTTPYWAPVAERWPGPVVYYLTDLIAEYESASRPVVERLDRKMCAVAALLCPNSQRLAEYLNRWPWCAREKITIVPNATRARNIFDAPPGDPAPLPEDLVALERPVAGVIGDLSGNMDWRLLLETVERTPELSWAFVGPTTSPIRRPAQSHARSTLMQMSGRVRFTSGKPYGDLHRYARALDVAVLPYLRREPTFSGSSTRFYEHLAACRPMLATRGFFDLYDKEPLLKLVDSADQLVAELRRLEAQNFDDGLQQERWRASRTATWDCRAQQMVNALAERLAQVLPSKCFA